MPRERVQWCSWLSSSIIVVDVLLLICSFGESNVLLEAQIKGMEVIENDIIRDPPITMKTEFSSGQLSNPINANTWPNGTIPYTYSNRTLFTKAQYEQVEEVMRDFERLSCIRWVPIVDPVSSPIRVLITKNQFLGCAAHVGYKSTLRILSLADGCFTYGTIFHEMLHITGFFHEQSRPDRDDFVEIHWENIANGVARNFAKYDATAADSLQQYPLYASNYDFHSIMHYSQTSFSKNGKPTVYPRQLGVEIGQRQAPSKIDLWELNQLYKCPKAASLLPPQLTILPTDTRATFVQPLPFSCTFDTGICFNQPWHPSVDQQDFQRVSHQIILVGSSGPATDHTQPTQKTGFYLHMDAYKAFFTGSSAVLVSPALFSGASSACISFYYYTAGNSQGYIAVYIASGSPDAKWKRVWKSDVISASNMWLLAFMKIDLDNISAQRFHLIIEGHFDPSNLVSVGQLAIDDFMATDCASDAPKTQPLPFHCDFENGWCGLKQEAFTDVFNWKISGAVEASTNTKTTTTHTTGPRTDHTWPNGNSLSGHFAISNSVLYDQGDKSLLYSPLFDTGLRDGANEVGQVCVRFWYNVFGQYDIGELSVFVEEFSRPRLKSLVAAGQTTMGHAIDPKPNKRQMLFNFIGAIVHGRYHDIAIDDLSFTKGHCSSFTNSHWQLSAVARIVDVVKLKTTSTTTSTTSLGSSAISSKPAKTTKSPKTIILSTSSEAGDGFPQIPGYEKFTGNCPKNVLMRYTINSAPTAAKCAILCDRAGPTCVGYSFIFEPRSLRCLLKKLACDKTAVFKTNTVRFYLKIGPAVGSRTSTTITTPRPRTVLDPCASAPCRNGAHCQVAQSSAYGQTKQYLCICQTGYGGAFCEHIIDQCLVNNPCKNNGRCSTGGICHCLDGYHGVYCEFETQRPMNPCETRPCLNGNCYNVDTVNYGCSCHAGYFGRNCDQLTAEVVPRVTVASNVARAVSGQNETQHVLFQCDFEHSLCGLNALEQHGSFPRRQLDRAHMVTPTLFNGASVCVRFYYHMFGDGIGSLHLYWIDSSQPQERSAFSSTVAQRREIFSRHGAQSPEWQLAEVEWNNTGRFQLEFDAVRGSSFESDIAIDDIVVLNGPCGPLIDWVTTPFNCSFEHDWCHFTQETDDQFDWSRTAVGTPSLDTGPYGGFPDGGYYVFAEASSRAPDDKARLLSSRFKGLGTMCIVFYYHMRGQGMGALRLYLRHERPHLGHRYYFWQASGHQGTRWIGVRVPIRVNEFFRIGFEAEVGSNWDSDVAIDSIQLFQGFC